MKRSAAEYATLLALLDEGLELPIEARSRWIDTLPDAHSGLRPTLRRLLLKAPAAETTGSVNVYDHIAAAMEAAARLTDPSDLREGEQVGPYELVREIGRGGMGYVWLAERADGAFKRSVALKLPFMTWAARIGDRVARERDILASLEHPNIARFYDAGLDDKGRPFMAMEYVQGQPIDVYCTERDLPLRERLGLVLDVAKAVAYAHSKLVVHRDLKPANLLVTDEGQVRLLDFGVAKLLLADAAGDMQATRFAERALTLGYASPEQIRGEPVGTASDVYSLGVVLHELLTGRKLFRNEQCSGDWTPAQTILSLEPPRPSDVVDGAAPRHKLRGDLDTIVLKALKRDPRERYSAIVELADDIERHLRGDPVRARRDSAWYRTRKFIARHTLPVAIATAAFIGIIVTAAVAIREAGMAAAQRDRAIALSARAEAASEFQSMLITEAAQSDKPITVSDMLARSESLAKSEFSGNPEHLAAVLRMLGNNYHTMGQDARAEPLLSEALQAVKQSPDTVLRSQLTCLHALVLGALGKTVEARRALHGVIDDPQTSVEIAADCLEDLAYLAQNEEDAKGALEFGTLAWQRLQRVPNVSLVNEGLYLGSIGYAHYLNNHNDEADRYYARALEKFVKAGRAGSAEAISVRNNWAMVSDGAGNPKRAFELYDETMRIVAKNGSGTSVPTYLVANRARALENIGRFVEARAVYGECVAESEKLGNPTTTAYCLVGEGSTLQAQGDLTAAKVYCDKAATLIAASVPAGTAAGSALQVVRGRIALSDGRLDEARALLDKVIGDQSTVNANALIARAEVNLDAGRLPEAILDARTALARAQALQSGFPYSYKTGLAWLILARSLAAEGAKDSARDALLFAVQQLSNTVDVDHPALRTARRLLAAEGAAT